DRGRRRDRALWGAAVLATVAPHPYGVLVLGGHGLFIVLAHRRRIRAAIPAFAAVFVLGIPFWLTDVILAGRFDVGVGGGGAQLGSPRSIGWYLWWVAGDLAAGWNWVLLPMLAVTVVGLLSLRREARAFTAAVRRAPVLLAVAVAALIVAEGAWTKHRTPALVTGEPHARIVARHQASAWLAATSRPDDVLFGYEPVFLGAWEHNHHFSRTVVPRA